MPWGNRSSCVDCCLENMQRGGYRTIHPLLCTRGVSNPVAPSSGSPTFEFDFVNGDECKREADPSARRKTEEKRGQAAKTDERESGVLQECFFLTSMPT